MVTVDSLDFSLNGTEGFFNENEQALLAQVQAGGSGVYKLTQDTLGQFTAVEKVTEVDDALTLEEGRIIVSGEAGNTLYVKFEV